MAIRTVINKIPTAVITPKKSRLCPLATRRIARAKKALTAFIVPREGQECTADEIIAWCARRMTKFKIPSRIRFRGSLPHDGGGAVLKEVLKREVTTQ